MCQPLSELRARFWEQVPPIPPTDHLQTIYTSSTDNPQIILTWWSSRYAPDLYDPYDLAHVAGWGPYNLHDLLWDSLMEWICTEQILRILS